MSDAEREYRDKPFAPFWEKERLLRQMGSIRAAKVAKRDIFLPFFTKKKFVKDDDKK